jgi:Mg2+/Co2+ transporter CorB
MTPTEWAIVGIMLALAFLAIGLFAMWRLGSGKRRRFQRKAQVTPQPLADAPTPEPAAPAQNGGRVRSVIELHDLEVSDVMVHRMNMRSINVDDPPDVIVRTVIESPHTRMPLWRGSLDNIVGVLHARDVLRALGDAGFDFTKVDATRIARKPWFVPDTTRLDDQLNAFLRRKSHFAVVVDEYGEVRGLVTLEDIIEEIVGEIADEHDVDVQGVRQEADGSVVVDGSVAIRDLNRALGWSLPEDEATTIAGLVIHETQSIPEEKQAFTFHGKRFVILNREKNRITSIRIRTAAEAVPVPPPAPPVPGG